MSEFTGQRNKDVLSIQRGDPYFNNTLNMIQNNYHLIPSTLTEQKEAPMLKVRP